MDYTFEQLKHKTVGELREIAKDNQHEALQGYTQLNKGHLPGSPAGHPGWGGCCPRSRRTSPLSKRCMDCVTTASMALLVINSITEALLRAAPPVASLLCESRPSQSRPPKAHKMFRPV